MLLCTWPPIRTLSLISTLAQCRIFASMTGTKALALMAILGNTSMVSLVQPGFSLEAITATCADRDAVEIELSTAYQISSHIMKSKILRISSLWAPLTTRMITCAARSARALQSVMLGTLQKVTKILVGSARYLPCGSATTGIMVTGRLAVTR